MSASQITEQAAHDMGAQGAPASEHERLLFEAWMRGHCWALCAQWDGAGYRGSAENGGYVCPRAMNTRQLWAAWRDRAALSAQAAPSQDTEDAARYRLLRRGQHWSVVNGIGDVLRADALDSAIDTTSPQQEASQ